MKKHSSRGATYAVKRFASEVAKDTCLPTKVQRNLENVLSKNRIKGKACCSDCSPFKKTKQGGPKERMSDDQIYEELMDHCEKARGSCARTQKPCMNLRKSLKKAQKETPALRKYSYSGLAKRVRLHKSKLGISHMKHKTDRCPICYAWSTCVCPRIVEEINTIRIEFLKLLPGYETDPLHRNLKDNSAAF